MCTQLYSLSDGRYTGRAIVPLLWDTAARRIVSNGSARIVNDGDRNPHGIIAEAPSVDWSARHDRDRLGPAQVWYEATGPETVEVGEFESVQ